MIFESSQVQYPTTVVHIGKKVGKLPELIEYHDTTVGVLVQVLVRYLQGGRIAKERPTIRLAGGWAWVVRRGMPSIFICSAKLKQTEAAIEQYRDQIDARKAENYGFASVVAVPYAHIVASMLRKKHPKGTDIALAPNPKHVIWENLNKTEAQLRRKRTAGFFYLALACFFNTAPLFVLSVLANLNSQRNVLRPPHVLRPTVIRIWRPSRAMPSAVKSFSRGLCSRRPLVRLVVHF